MRNRISQVCSLLLIVLPFHAAAEQDQKTLIDELKVVVERARAERVADRWLQRDLDDLIARYDVPELTVRVFENFQDRRFAPSEGWRFSGPGMEVDRGYGLVSVVDPNASSGRAADARSEPDLSREEAVAGLLVNLLLQDKVRDEPDHRADGQSEAVPKGPAVGMLPADIPNAFLVEMELTLEETSEEARVAFSVFQSEAEAYGYALKLKTGPRGYVEIERQRQQQRAIVDSRDLGEVFSDGQSHRLAWLHDGSGRIVVTLDDAVLLDASDKAFRDDYRQFKITNDSGNLAIHHLKISG